MGRAKDLTGEQKSYITAVLHNTDLSQREIAAKCKVSQASVNRLARKLKANQHTNNHRKGRCGRKKIITPRGKRFLRDIVVDNRRATNKDIKNKFEEAGYKVSERTIRRNLYELGFKCRRPVKKPRLTPAMVKKRLEWANSYRHLTVDDWLRVRNRNILICPFE